MHKTWIEAALNGPWSRARQPGIPDTVEAIVAEGITCAAAGACILHVHAYDGGGPQTFDWQVYAQIIEGIRTKVDVPVYPSIPSAGIGVGSLPEDATTRFAHLEALAERGLLEFAVVDPGSVNFTELSAGPDSVPARTYLNPESHVRHGLAFAARFWLSPRLRDLRAGVHAGRRGLGAGHGRQDADLPLHVLRHLCLRLSAKALRPCRAPGPASGRGSSRALDDCRAWRGPRPPHFRDRAPWRAYPRGPRGCAVWHSQEQPGTGRGGRDADPRPWQRARERCRNACTPGSASPCLTP